MSAGDGLNSLCAGCQQFFQHIGDALRFMANAVRFKRVPARVRASAAQQDDAWRRRWKSSLTTCSRRSI
jgi:hypothetical protein